jgi:hypothetical protein
MAFVRPRRRMQIRNDRTGTEEACFGLKEQLDLAPQGGLIVFDNPGSMDLIA